MTSHYIEVYICTATTGQVIAVVRDLVAVIIFVYIDVVLEFQSADVGFPLVMTQSIRDDSKQMWLWFPCLLTQEFTSTSLIFPTWFCRSPRPTMVLSCFKWAEGVLMRGKCENEFILKEYFGLNASERSLWQKIIWIGTSLPENALTCMCLQLKSVASAVLPLKGHFPTHFSYV